MSRSWVPALDFANKDDGYDFYPQQTIQPFALMDSLIRLGLASDGDLFVTTFDLSTRINQHLEASRDRARTGGDYSVRLPLHGDELWNPRLIAYWQRFGDRIGTETKPPLVPPNAGAVRVRAVRVPAARVMQIVPHDLNIVLERLEPLTADEQFDLVVATNVFVYYDMKLSDRYTTVAYRDRLRDYIFRYERQ